MARILVAEDDKAMRVFLDRALSRSGHVVDAVPTGDTAAMRAANEPFDLLVTDINMPGMNGVDLARQLMDRTPKQAVLFVTGYTAQALEATDVLARGAKVLSKPFELSQLVELVNGVLSHDHASSPQEPS